MRVQDFESDGEETAPSAGCIRLASNRSGPTYTSRMKLTKYEHATVRFEKDGVSIVTDPGTLSPEVSDLLGQATAALVTHEHFDHFDVDAVRRALGDNAGLHVYGPEGLAELVGGDMSHRFTVVGPGETFSAGPFEVSTFGGTHAVLHPDLPTMSNVSYLIDGTVFHPGDSYEVPDARIETLLMPTSGPWTSMHKAIDFIRAVAPTRAFQIHEAELSEVGREYALYFLGPDGPGGAQISSLAVGEGIDV